MIPTYQIENLTGGLDAMFQNGYFGAKKKSETAIKFGIKNFIITLVLILIVLTIPVLISMFQ